MSSFVNLPAIPSFAWPQCHSSVPATFPKIGAQTCCAHMARGRGRCAFSITVRRQFPCVIIVCGLGILLTLGLPLTGKAEPASLAQATLRSDSAAITPHAGFVTEASHRFGIPEHWILKVIEVESGGKAHAVSSRGALGLMQIMPQTWVELSVRYGLGIDPFDPHDNIVAGTAYLSEMLDRFGEGGFLAAYNVGPNRYEEHLAAGRPLPDETQAYVRRLAALLGIDRGGHGNATAKQSVDWRHAPMFVRRTDSPSANGSSASVQQSLSSSKDLAVIRASTLVPRATGLFLRRSDEVQPR
ncbi:murein transglycosylase [Bradyrhizobium ottawaense]|uniref:lytic transglycosylase domain-containing protein n=1 Tax=Bradyrhizobium ottawaense TaxID=931866 RepID=UPI000BE9710C|nr:lytic transglycosylase domain-containing protein [Bradyrhizobium ottawaense]PDT65796.1 murein transglycosylase [Bradyrhizobium ottawaense]